MNQFKAIENSTTGHRRMQGSVKLITPLSSAVQQNTNGKNYKVATVEFVTASGEIKQCGANIYEGNYSKGELTVGREYLATVTIAPNKEGKLTPYMQMSHLIANGGYADLSDFEIEEVAETSAAQVLAGEIKN